MPFCTKKIYDKKVILIVKMKSLGLTLTNIHRFIAESLTMTIYKTLAILPRDIKKRKRMK